MMTIREVIDMLVMIFKTLMEIIGPFFGGKEEGEETETPEAGE